MNTHFGIYAKPPNYRQEANCFSAAFICWTNRIFRLGNKRDLFESDLPEPLKEHTANILGDKVSMLWSKEYEKAKTRQVKPSLTRVLCQCFLGEYFAYGVFLAFMELLLKPMQPLFIGLLLRYFTAANNNNTNPKEFPMYIYRIFYYSRPNQAAIQTDEAWLYASCVVICSLISVCIQHPYMLAVMHLGMKLRVACMSLMYRKTLRMSLLALSPVTVGNVVNLMSNDATRFDIVTMFLHYLWISPLQLIMFVYIMYAHVGAASIVGGLTLFVFIPIQIILANFNKGLRWKTAYKTDERVRLMNEIISGIQVIKMYAWEFAFCDIINRARRKEMGILVQTSYIRGVVMSMIMFTARSAIFVTLISSVLLFNSKLSSETVFIVSGYYIIMRASMTVFFPQGVTQFAETIITIQRTRDYLMNEEAIFGDTTIIDPNFEKPQTISAQFNDPTSSNFSINQFIPDPSIRIIECYAKWASKFVLRDVELTMNVGEMVVIIGQVGSGKSSLLQVILKELPVDQGYVSVRGRVSYCSQDPWLFAGSVRQNIVFGHPYIKDRYRRVCKVCALLKDFKKLPFGDQTIVGERGISLSGGQRARINLARCIYKDADIYIMDDPLSAVDTHVGAQMFNECIMEFLHGKIRVLVTHQLQFLQNVDQLVIMEKGRVVASGTYDKLQKSGVDFAQFLTLTQESSPEKIEAKLPQKETSGTLIQTTLSDADVFHDMPFNRKSLLETRESGIISCKMYRRYWRSGGNWCVIAIVVILFILTQGVASGTDFLIAQWVKNEDAKHRNATLIHRLTTKQFMITYSVFTEMLIISSITRSFLFFYVCLQASIRLHDDMFHSIAFGHMRFFNTNPSGRILNRFSKDMGAVDEDLPYAMIDFFQMLLNLLGVLVVLSATCYFLIPPIALILASIYYIRKYYLKTSRSLKRVEGIVRSYVYAHLNASIQGLPTIRTHNAEQILVTEFDNHMNMHSSAWYLFISTARSLSLWTDVICVILITISAYGFLIMLLGFGLSVDPSDVGLCITQCLTLTGLIPWGMRQSAEMENQMTSVERIIDYTNIEQEPRLRSKRDKMPPSDWPSEGRIIFQDTELKYSRTQDLALHGMNIEIHPREKIGIVGRTGAGKSSIISALFRLAFQSGAIIIDGVNIFEIGLHDLRRRIAIIPQEPAIFTGNMRFNLDPFNQHADQILLGALSIVDLEIGKRDVLNKPLAEGGANFSAGQKQLVCLARAIVRHNKILVLDEATANMDAKTDQLIQTTIRAKFADCTVLTIAHRLQTIMDSDKILVMHAGTVVEFDDPHTLLQLRDGYFTSMVNKTGKSTADSLKKIAEQCYLRKMSPKPVTTDDEDAEIEDASLF